MKYELGDHAVVRCPETGLEADIEFKVKGWVSGAYNAVGGYIKDSKSGKNLYEISGFWNAEMYLKDLSTGKKQLIFDAAHSRPTAIRTRPLEEQSARESQKLWDSTVRAIKKADQKVATEEKSKIEDEQRREAAERGEGSVWQPKLFKAAPPGDEQNLDWILNAPIDTSAPPKQQVEQILAIAPILPGQGVKTENQAPPSQQSGTTAGQPPSASGDLIDFGQSDASAVPSQPTKSAAPAAPTSVPAGQLQQPLQPQSFAPAGKRRPGDPIRRMDSLGNEEIFSDAET